MDDTWVLCDTVRTTAYAVHVFFRHGFPEKVYENALANRLRSKGVSVLQQHPIAVFDEDGSRVGEYFADLLVAGNLVVEVKAARSLAPEHEAQLLGYLRATGFEHGLLLNFGARRFQIRKFALAVSESILSFSLFAPFALFCGHYSYLSI
jgi:GxxExxY protein